MFGSGYSGRATSSLCAFALTLLMVLSGPIVDSITPTAGHRGTQYFNVSQLIFDPTIAILASTSLAILARFALSWRLIDTQVNRSDNKTTTRGSLFELVVCVSAFALVFALILQRPYHPIVYV